MLEVRGWLRRPFSIPAIACMETNINIKKMLKNPRKYDIIMYKCFWEDSV